MSALPHSATLSRCGNRPAFAIRGDFGDIPPSFPPCPPDYWRVTILSVYRFLPGLIIVQAATAVLVFAASGASGPVHWGLVAVAALSLTLVVGFWFASIAAHAHQDILAGVKEQFARERERLAVAAEAEKRTFVEDSHRKILEETNRAHAKANFKLGAAVAGLLGIAGMLLYIELFTLSLVALTTAGGALAGYVARARQDARALVGYRADDKPLTAAYTVEHSGGGARPPRPAIGRNGRKS